jgi:hypothetical protein
MAKTTRRGGSIGGKDPGPMRSARYSRGPGGSNDGGAMGPIKVHMTIDVEIPDLDYPEPRVLDED